jgi:hypothetical protein
VLRTLICTAAVVALIACQPAAPKPEASEAPAAPALKTGLELVEEQAGIDLYDWTGGEDPAFRLYCTQDSPIITVQADRKQFAKDLVATKAALVLTGESFTDDVKIEEGPNAQVALVVGITPALLKALAGATTARLAVEEANASFAETAVDSGDTFEKLAAKCSELSKVKMAP